MFDSLITSMMQDPVFSAAILVLIIPISCFAYMAINHSRIPRNGDWLATGCLGICVALSLYVFSQFWFADHEFLSNRIVPWLPTSSISWLNGGFLVDSLTATMLVVVSLISFLVHLFSLKYMEGDIRYGRYYCGLQLFTASMVGLVLANNLLFLFMFWELVGLSSYLLIGHWYEKKSAANAAMKAFITTRVGDVGMFIGLLICYSQTGSLQYADIFAAVESGSLEGTWRTIAGLGIFLGAMGKSAQFPFHVWLPDAMEGPTPVSALIHAATMVAAGVYLTGRLLPLFDAQTLLFIAYIGAFTALFSASIALVQDDIKKVLAYSTVSQLGYMMLALGVGGYTSGLFHLTTHALFKGGLFLGAGAVIHAMHHEQSMSKYGGLAFKIPYTTACYILFTLALVGIPGFSGHYSKDSILADVLVFAREYPEHWFLPLCGFGTVLLTAFYMSRQIFLTFFGTPRDKHTYERAHDGPWQMLLPLILLAILSVIGGYGHWFDSLNPKRSGIEQLKLHAQYGESLGAPEYALMVDSLKHHDSEHHEIAAHQANTHSEKYISAHHEAKGYALWLALAGISLAGLMYLERKGRTIISAKKVATTFRPIYVLLWNKYYIDELYNVIFIAGTKALSRIAAICDSCGIDRFVNSMGPVSTGGAYVVDQVDRIVVDGGAVMGTAQSASFSGRILQQLQTGLLRNYLFVTVTSVIVVILLGISMVL